MSRFIIVLIALTALFAALSCSSASKPAGESSKQASTGHATEVMTDEYEAAPPRNTVPAVMQAKLAHAQAVLEGLALANYAQVEANAMDLKRISLGGDGLGQESAAYFEFSRSFRNVCDDLINHAREKNARAIVDDYGNLTDSCVACHEYLRKQRQNRDLPGRVSMGGDAIRQAFEPS